MNQQHPILQLLLLALILGLAACSNSTPAPLTINGSTMGTTYTVKVSADKQELDPDTLKEEIEALLTRINSLMSTYDPNSELSRFNAMQKTGWFTVSPETLEVIMAAGRISGSSRGGFDVTVGPLVNLWGFGPEQRPERVPADQEIAMARQITGFDKLTIDPAGSRIRKSVPELTVDLSAIAKGYGVDALSQLLSTKGLTSHMVEIGGEIRAMGRKADNNPWRIGLEKPTDQGRLVNTVIELRNRAVATSGTYRNYFEENGVRYSHTIDPASGRPISHNLVSVSVLSDTCMVADGWATALMVLGPERGLELAEARGLAASFLTKAETGFSQRTTSEWNTSLH